MNAPLADRDIVRRLAEDYATIAALPLQRERAAEWTRLNDLVPGRPLLWLNELPWQELNYNDELTLLCQDAFCRGVEWELRSTLYQWRHLPGDMVIEPVSSVMRLMRLPRTIHARAHPTSTLLAPIHSVARPYLYPKAPPPIISTDEKYAATKDSAVTHGPMERPPMA